MKLATTVTILFAFFIGFSNACVKFWATLDWDKTVIKDLHMVDNGVEVCSIDRTDIGNQDPIWMNCIDGHHAWIAHDLSVAGYARGDRGDLRFHFEWTQQYPTSIVFPKYWVIWGNKWGCGCTGYQCKFLNPWKQ
jgi:hypothetical protein